MCEESVMNDQLLRSYLNYIISRAWFSNTGIRSAMMALELVIRDELDAKKPVEKLIIDFLTEQKDFIRKVVREVSQQKREHHASWGVDQVMARRVNQHASGAHSHCARRAAA